MAIKKIDLIDVIVVILFCEVKVNKKKWFIPFIFCLFVGIVMFVVGVCLPNSMDSESGYTFRIFKDFLSMFGILFFMTGLFLILVTVLSFRKNNRFVNDVHKNVFGHIMDEMEQIKQSTQKNYCEYCGSLLDKNEKKCQSCGAKAPKK